MRRVIYKVLIIFILASVFCLNAVTFATIVIHPVKAYTFQINNVPDDIKEIKFVEYDGSNTDKSSGHKYNMSNDLKISKIRNNTFTYEGNYVPGTTGEEVEIGIIMKDSKGEFKSFLVSKWALYTQKSEHTKLVVSFDYNSGEITDKSYIQMPNVFDTIYSSMDRETFAVLLSVIICIVVLIMFAYFVINSMKKRKKS